ncbi:MAG: DUF998 domain-containing protein [bacterium]
MKKLNLLQPVYLALLLTMFILPYFSAPGYSIIKNTTSHLGAQATPNAWIMNLIFILLGLSTIIDGWRHLKEFWFQKIVLTVFGLALIGTAFFRHAPITTGIPFDRLADEWHSNLASLTGFSFTLLAISSAFIVKKPRQRILALAVGIGATILSLLFFTLPAYAGLWQRLIFIFSFAWLIYFFNADYLLRRQI